MTSFSYDIIIIGSGIVGAAAALALAQNTSLNIAILDAKSITTDWQDQKYDFRVSAISLASQRIFSNLNVWEKIRNKRISPYTHMHVWEEQGAGKIEFDCAQVSERALGFIIEDSVLRTSLHEVFGQHENIHFIHPVKLIALSEKKDVVELLAENQQIYSAKLLIAADGANSWVRDQIDVQMKTHDYNHTAIVTTVQTELSHQATAWQRFLKTGPLAFLPLQNPNTSSIVWSTVPEHANELLAMDEVAFRNTLRDALENRLGEIIQIDKRYHFPLQMRHAKNYVKEHIALIGDAARTIHPLAGQGVNLGLLDALCLVETIVDAVNKNRNYASMTTLRRYERWRKGDNLVMLAMVEMLKSLFMSDKTLVKTFRSFGLNFTDRVSFLKSFFARYALGNRGDLPKLAGLGSSLDC